MSIRRSIRRRIARVNQALDTMEALGSLPKCSTATLALAGNTFSGARRRMAKAAKQQAARMTPEELKALKGEYGTDTDESAS